MSNFIDLIKDSTVFRWVFAVFAAAAVLGLLVDPWCIFRPCPYLKIEEPPDANKANPADPNDVTCFAATAANMLAGAGYGEGNSLQERANKIYQQIVYDLGQAEGWVDQAINKWLKEIGYSEVYECAMHKAEVIVDPYATDPYNCLKLPVYLAKLLRSCKYIGLVIEYSTSSHAITYWGDNWNPNKPDIYPTKIWVTDSDRGDGYETQSYEYCEQYVPSDPTSYAGKGWHINYDECPDKNGILHAIKLIELDGCLGGEEASFNIGSYNISTEELSTNTVNYTVGSSRSILKYYPPTILPGSKQPVKIGDSDPGRKSLDVEWDFSDNPLPSRTSVFISTSAILFTDSSLDYENFNFTYEGNEVSKDFPEISWHIKSQPIENAHFIPDARGGYIIGSFVLYEDKASTGLQAPLAEYRFVHEYPYSRNPENHDLYLAGSEDYVVKHLKFGHRYAKPSVKTLWEFDDKDLEPLEDFEPFRLDKHPRQIEFRFSGLLPYPKKK